MKASATNTEGLAQRIEALAAAKNIVDEFLAREYKCGMTAKQLYAKYTSFGDDPSHRTTAAA
jgi:hypothetical protein